MITDLIITAVLGGINALLSLMPNWQLPTATENGFGGQIGQYAAMVDEFFPISTIVQIFLSWLGLRLLLAGWDFIVFVYHQFWGSN